MPKCGGTRQYIVRGRGRERVVVDGPIKLFPEVGGEYVLFGVNGNREVRCNFLDSQERCLLIGDGLAATCVQLRKKDLGN